MTKFLKKLQNQLLALLLLSTIIPVTIVGWYGIFSSSTALSELSLSQLDSLVKEKAEKVNAFLHNVNEDVLFLSKVPPIQGIIRARAGQGIDQQSSSSYENWVERLETIFSALMQAKPYYMQLRYLNETGQEMVRVDSDGVNIKIISRSQMQNKSDRDYFIKGMQVGLNKIYVSPVDLNQELGQIERPFKPVIRYGIVTFDSAGNKKGIVIANVFANEFIKIIKEANGNHESQALMVNQDGYYISHPDASKEWGFDLKTNEKLDKDYPLQISQEILRGDEGHNTKLDRYIITYHPIPTNPEQQQGLVLIYQTEKSVVFAAVDRFKMIATLIIFLSLALVLPLGYFRLKRLVELIKKLSHNISEFSWQIFSTLEQQERITTSQSSSVNNTAITIEQISTVSKQTAREAENVAAGALQALNLAEEGANLLQQTLKGMIGLQEKVEVISQQSQRLGNQTSQIGNISTLANLVSNLANQTNMLALNAAVEAVRAGEHGQGFAIVATEIRKLADQSRDAAEKINAIVPEIQAAIKATVQATEEGSTTLESGLRITTKAADTFQGVRQAANHVLIGNQNISVNAKDQASAIQEIVNAMNSINQSVAETADGIRYTKSGVEKLNEQAFQLKGIV